MVSRILLERAMFFPSYLNTSIKQTVSNKY